MHTADKISDWFLAWAEEEDAELSNLKLQKLLYYAQGHALAQTGKPLFSDRIEAWAHGPVVPKVYRRFKDCGSNPIDPDTYLPEAFDWDEYRDVEDQLIRIWNTYGKYAAWVLRNKTHKEAPWLSTFNADNRSAVISTDKMTNYFASV